MTIRTGLIGYGLAGSVFHAPLIQACPSLSLAAIATSRAGPEGVPTVADPQALIADSAIGLVVIATPNATHFPLALAALEAGKHVVIDKPFTATVEQADRLVALAREQDRRLTVFHNRRWDGDFLTIAKLLASQRLGEVMLCEMHWDRFRLEIRPGWKDRPAGGTGLLYDLGSHLIDQALVLFGPPDEVSADLAVQRPSAAVDDYFALTLHYGSRRILLSASTVVAATRPRFGLHGTSASFVKYGLDPQEGQLKSGARPGKPGFGEEEPRMHGIMTLPDGGRERIATEPGRYVDFYAAVAAAIAEGAPLPVDPADARLGLEIIEAVRTGAGEGRRVTLSRPSEIAG